MTIERIEVTCVARGKLTCLEVTAAQIWITKCVGALAREKMKAQPAPVHARDALGFSKERDKQKENEIRIDLRLELQIARKIFGGDLASSVFELKCRMQRVIKFFHEHDQGVDIAVADPCPWIVLLQLFNEPARIINTDVKLVACAP